MDLKLARFEATVVEPPKELSSGKLCCNPVLTVRFLTCKDRSDGVCSKCSSICVPGCLH